MAKNEIKVNITAETTQFERGIASIKNRMRTLFDANALNFTSLNPYALIAKGIGQAVNAVVDSFKNWRKGLEEIATATERTAKDLDTTTLQASRLEAAARAAGISAKDYAAALDNIKAGKTTLETQAEQWERIAGSAKTAQERTRSFAALIEAERKKQHENATAAEKITATLSGIKGSAKVAETYIEDIKAGRTNEIKPQAFYERGLAMGYTRRTLGGADTIELAAAALNRIIQDEAKSKEAAAIKAKKAEEAAAEARLKTLEAEEAAQKAAMDRVRAHEREIEAARAKATAAAQAQQAAYDKTAREAYALLNTLHQAHGGEAWDRLQELYGSDAEALYARGARLTETPEKQEKDLADKLIAQREELAAKRDNLEQEKANLEQSLSAYRHPLSSPDFITSAGGSLIGNGAYTLQQAQRLAAIEKQDTQKEQLAQLKAINAAIRALDE
ncbi:MAG: hypothetical protein ACI4W7_04010 [Candidatus Spyradenecus sp.]